MNIQNKVFIVTGAASGLGAGTARMLAREGAQVVLADVQDKAGEQLAQELGQTYVHCDVTQAADGEKTVATATQKGALFGLVNCAGIATASRTVGREGPHALELFQKTIAVNLVGSFNMARLAAQAMSLNTPEATGERGAIINTASVAAFDGQIGQAAYAASKGGLTSLTLTVARDLMNEGIRVNTILPGIFDTPLMARASDAVREALAAAIPFPKRLGQPDEFAALALSIITNPYLNGENIRLDGAIRMSPR